MHLIRAYCYSSGVIGFTANEFDQPPKGTLILAYGEKGVVKPTLLGLARHGYEGVLLVPGVPECRGDQIAALAKVAEFYDRVQKGMERVEVIQAVKAAGGGVA